MRRARRPCGCSRSFLEIERLRLALGLGGDHELLHRDDFGSEAQRERCGHSGENGDGELLRIGAGGFGTEAVIAGWQRPNEKAALTVGDGGARRADEREAGALHEVTRGVVHNHTAKAAGGGALRGEGQRDQ